MRGRVYGVVDCIVVLIRDKIRFIHKQSAYPVKEPWLSAHVIDVSCEHPHRAGSPIRVF